MAQGEAMAAAALGLRGRQHLGLPFIGTRRGAHGKTTWIRVRRRGFLSSSNMGERWHRQVGLVHHWERRQGWAISQSEKGEGSHACLAGLLGHGLVGPRRARWTMGEGAATKLELGL